MIGAPAGGLDQPLFGVQAEARGAGLGVRSVALEAVLGQDRSDLLAPSGGVRARRLGSGQRGEADSEEEKFREHEMTIAERSGACGAHSRAILEVG